MLKYVYSFRDPINEELWIATTKSSAADVSFLENIFFILTKHNEFNQNKKDMRVNKIAGWDKEWYNYIQFSSTCQENSRHRPTQARYFLFDITNYWQKFQTLYIQVKSSQIIGKSNFVIYSDFLEFALKIEKSFLGFS